MRGALNHLREQLDEVNAKLYEAHARANANAARASQSPPRKAQSLRRERRRLLILLAEDEGAPGIAYTDKLKSFGHEVIWTRTLVEAREAIESRVGAAPFDAAILDLLIPTDALNPYGSGASLVPILRAQSARTRILICTQMGQAAAVSELRLAGVDPESVEIIGKRPNTDRLRSL